MSPQTASRQTALADVADVRDHVRERDEFRVKVMEAKRRPEEISLAFGPSGF